jgi:BirA family biotin operon repressor/biotin-[acetyl-CoA-carboxylase] ligase
MTPYRVARLDAVDSTNAEAMRRAQAGEPGPLWILADVQTAGRGRNGRSWSSEPGNLHASLLVTLALPQPRAYQLALVAGVAVVDALRAALQPAPPGLELKWPNDILVDGAKAGGILVESSTGPAGLAAVIGIGLNVASHPEGLDRPATHLAAHAGSPKPPALLDTIAETLAAWLVRWDEGRGFAAVREAWLNRAHPIGERMGINTGTERVVGSFRGLDADGALLIDTDGRIRRFTFGDVSLAR